MDFRTGADAAVQSEDRRRRPQEIPHRWRRRPISTTPASRLDAKIQPNNEMPGNPITTLEIPARNPGPTTITNSCSQFDERRRSSTETHRHWSIKTRKNTCIRRQWSFIDSEITVLVQYRHSVSRFDYVRLYICLYICLCICLYICQYIFHDIRLYICHYVCLRICHYVCLYVCLFSPIFAYLVFHLIHICIHFAYELYIRWLGSVLTYHDHDLHLSLLVREKRLILRYVGFIWV